MSDIVDNERPCMWPLSHRDRRHASGRTCGCACWLPPGHDGPHACDQEVAAS